MMAAAGTIRQSWISVYYETLYQRQPSGLWPHTLYGEGFLLVEACLNVVVSWRKADVVDYLGLKPCCSLAGERNSLIEGKMSASTTLAVGHSSEMGLYEVPCDESLPGLGIGKTNEVFQIDGRRKDLRESL